jgi:hypothetical protein
MLENAALLVDEVFPEVPIRQWVLSFPFQLSFLLARYPELMGKVLGIVYRRSQLICFNIDIDVCEHCGGQVKVVATIEDPKVIE